MTRQRQVGWLAAGVAVFGFGAGCGGGGNEPAPTGTPADPLGSVAVLDSVGQAFGDPTILSLSTLSQNLDLVGGLSAPVPAQTRAMLRAIRLTQRDLAARSFSVDVARAQQLRSLVPSLSAGRAPISGLQNNAGKTYELDPVTYQYFAGSLTGAPANGIRILLYLVNLNGFIAIPPCPPGGPCPPPTQVGYVDLTDEGGSGSSYALGVVVGDTGQAPAIFANYGIIVTPGANSFTVGTRPAGPNYVTDGTVRADFTSSISANSSTDQVTVSGSLTMSHPVVTAATSVTVDFTTNSAITVGGTFSFTHGGETGSLTLNATLDGTNNNDAVSASAAVRINNRLFLSYTKTPGGQEAFTRAGGGPTSPDEGEYFFSVLDAFGAGSSAIGGLADPGVEITGQGGIQLPF